MIDKSMTLAGNSTRMGEMRNAYRSLEKLNRIDRSEDFGVEWCIIVK